jgi:hypothetical protein
VTVQEPTAESDPHDIFLWVRTHCPQASLIWWLTANEGFGGRTPTEVLWSDDRMLLVRMVWFLESGVPT